MDKMDKIIYEKASPFDNSNLIKYLNLSLVLCGLFFNLFFIINSNKFNVEHVTFSITWSLLLILPSLFQITTLKFKF